MIDWMHHHLSDLRRSADFMRNDVAVPSGNDFIAPFRLTHEGQQVAQGAAADKQTGFLSHQLGSPSRKASTKPSKNNSSMTVVVFLPLRISAKQPKASSSGSSFGAISSKIDWIAKV